jgi:hypothetical protein
LEARLNVHLPRLAQGAGLMAPEAEEQAEARLA